ncbi:hypothetical protein GQ53DRAFT_859571 [Thozetella sp. PMI_491]|nr:hypothetical protein GQ53DRAFT_859571 [Thozetella sp. PMI_491]
MKWACTRGYPEGIRIAVKYGHPPSTYDGYNGHEEKEKLSTLCLTAQCNKPAAFKALLDLGARVDNATKSKDATMSQSRVLIRAIFHRKAEEELRQLFFEANLDEQVESIGQALSLSQPLVQCLLLPGSLDLAEALLDRGADPNRLYAFRFRESISPLSAAILSGHISMLPILLSRGANIHGKKLKSLTRRAIHIPVFAAAVAMGCSPHGLAAMKACLAAGADINHEEEVFKTRYPRDRKYPASWSRATPLSVFLDNMLWPSDHDGFEASALDGLDYLLTQGADIGFGEPNEIPPDKHTKFNFRRRLGVERLLDRLGLARLIHPRFYAAVKLLIERGSTQGHYVRLLKLYVSDETQIEAATRRRHRSPMRQAIGRFAKLIARDIPDHELNEVLARYIYSVTVPDYKLGFGFVTAVNALIRRGADINAACAVRTGPRMTVQLAPPRPVLQELFRDFFLWGAHNLPRNSIKRKILRQKLWVVRFLLSRGPDPGVPGGSDPCTVNDWLVHHMQIDASNTTGESRWFVQKLWSVVKHGSHAAPMTSVSVFARLV